MTLRRWLATTVVVVVVAAPVACSRKGESQSRRPLDTTAAPGAVVVSDDKVGFAVSIPASWKQLPTDAASFDREAEALSGQNTAGEKLAIGLAQLKSVVRTGAAMVAIDPQTGATANLIVLDAGGQSPTKIAGGSANQLRQNGATGVTHSSVRINGVPAVRQRFRTPFPGETGPVQLSETQVYAVRRGQAFILTLAGDSPALDGIAASLELA